MGKFTENICWFSKNRFCEEFVVVIDVASAMRISVTISKNPHKINLLIPNICIWNFALLVKVYFGCQWARKLLIIFKI